MLKHRIIPTLLFDSAMQCVKPLRFNRPYRRLGVMQQYIKVMERRNIDELILLDITATEEKRTIDVDRIRQLTVNLYCPVTYGGNVGSLDNIQSILANGADKVAIKTNKPLIYKAARKFGSQAIVAVMDIDTECPDALLLDAIVEAKTLEQDGAGEILLTDTCKDGTMQGYNLLLIESVSQSVKIPVIANGGCGCPLDMVKAMGFGASSVAAGSMFLYTEFTPALCAKTLDYHGIQVRLHEQHNTAKKAQTQTS